MTTGTPTKPVSERLLDATIGIIDADGEVAVRVQDVVAACGVQIPVLYRHFGNREGLVQAAQIRRLTSDLDAEVARLTPVFAAVDSATGFRALWAATAERLSTPERAALRARRVNVLGSTYGRPELAAEIARIQVRAVDSIAALLERPQREGWIRADLDRHAFAAWFGGQTVGRILIELGDTEVDGAAWDAISLAAVSAVLFD